MTDSQKQQAEHEHQVSASISVLAVSVIVLVLALVLVLVFVTSRAVDNASRDQVDGIIPSQHTRTQNNTVQFSGPTDRSVQPLGANDQALRARTPALELDIYVDININTDMLHRQTPHLVPI